MPLAYLKDYSSLLLIFQIRVHMHDVVRWLFMNTFLQKTKHSVKTSPTVYRFQVGNSEPSFYVGASWRATENFIFINFTMMMTKTFSQYIFPIEVVPEISRYKIYLVDNTLCATEQINWCTKMYIKATITMHHSYFLPHCVHISHAVEFSLWNTHFNSWTCTCNLQWKANYLLTCHFIMSMSQICLKKTT